ncbi:MAG: U32 family peptidase [Bryobacteraceae bacterium]|jgi:putative protease
MGIARKPEVMSPAGYWPQMEAALDAGADAVYFGLRHFTARAKVGFALGELPDAMAALHRRGARGFVTFNTLVFDHELREAARALAAIAEAGADAIIVQDLGILKLARAIAPDLELHASTQMSVTSAAGVRLAESLGARRVTLARELCLAEVRAIRAETNCELEIFVHGALCVAYSGQCFSSEAWGGRSANRGQCAQACRLPYELVVDGKVKPLGDARYLLSPGDLIALRQIPKIVGIGIAALKIEGRYKDADYVALATRAYRQAVDAAWEGREASIDARRELDLEQVYSRGSAPHFLNGTDHQAVVRGRAPRHRGVRMGSVTAVSETGVTIEPAEAHRLAPLKPGDGVVFDAADWRSPEEPEEGGRIFEVLPRGGSIELRFANRALDRARIRRGDLVWRTNDPELEKRIRALPAERLPVDVRVTAREGAPLVAVWEAGGVQVTAESAGPLGCARNRALDRDLLREQFSRLGNTPYRLDRLELAVEGAPFAPASLLNQVRRDAVERLEAALAAPRRTEIHDPMVTLDEIVSGGVGGRKRLPHFIATKVGQALPPANWTESSLHLLVRTPEQLAAAIEFRPASITLDYLDLYGLKPSLERVRAAGLSPRVASPRILKPGEERVVDFLLSCDCPILLRSAGLLDTLRSRTHGALAGDFSLNAANSITAAELLALGLDSLTPTHDLNAAQVADLARAAGAHRIETVAFHHLPVFHTEHCVFCRFLSTGSSYRDCGRPCDEHRLALRDSSGRAHPVMADVGCRNTVFGAEAQQASAHLEGWLAAGICHFRLEFAHESAAQVVAVSKAFAEALAGNLDFAELERRLSRISPGGITEGSLFVPANYLELPVLQ